MGRAVAEKRGLTLKSQTLDGDILVVFQGAEKSHLLVSGARWADKQLQYPAHDTGTGTSSKGHHWHTWMGHLMVRARETFTKCCWK
jgi:hypothetical protein